MNPQIRIFFTQKTEEIQFNEAYDQSVPKRNAKPILNGREQVDKNIFW